MESILEERSKEEATPNVWVVPLAFLSHVRCLLQFAELITSHNLSVTFFCTKWDEKSLGLHATIESWRGEGLDIRLRYIEMEEPDLSTGADEFEEWKRVFQRQEGWIDGILKHESGSAQSRPTCVISDLWMPGVHDSAVKYSVPAWVFSSFSLCYTGSAAYISQLQDKGILKLPSSPLDPISQEEFISLPGVPLLRLCDLDEVGIFSSHMMSPLANRNGRGAYKCEVLIFSTFEELESRAFHEYSKYLVHDSAVKQKKEKRNIYTVGPTFPLTTTPAAKSTPNEELHPSLKFLDGQSDSSVLFVAFGGTWQLSPEQMQEIAFGLEGSLQPFLCTLQPAAKTAEYPTGFVVDEIQAGLEIMRDPRGASLVSRKEVETKVRALFQCEEGKQARKNALRDIAAKSKR